MRRNLDEQGQPSRRLTKRRVFTVLFGMYAVGVLSNYVVAILRPTLDPFAILGSFTSTLISATIALLLIEHVRRATARTPQRRRSVALLDGLTLLWTLGIALIVLESWGRGFAEAPNFWSGFSRWQELVSPFNIANYIVLVVLLLPAIGATKLSARLSNRTRLTSSSLCS